jgi:glycosyltransferase involved in cell wall biosynthesis
MNDRIVVTIGICSKNSENTIRDAIESVLAQDFAKEKMEIIFVDDGDDGTSSIIREYIAKNEVSCQLFDRIRSGLSKARNAVVYKAKGDYIIWVDADMVLPKEHVRKQVEFMESHPDVAIAAARFCGLPEKNFLVHLQNLEWVAFNHLATIEGKLNIPCIVCGGATYRTKAIKQIGGFDERIIGACEDEEIELRVVQAGWSTYKITDTCYFESRKKTWKAVWKQFFWYGYGSHFLLHNKQRTVKIAQVLDPFTYSSVAYQLTGKKLAFMVPLQYYFKRIAWYFGFLKAHMNGYGHNQISQESKKMQNSSEEKKTISMKNYN